MRFLHEFAHGRLRNWSDVPSKWGLFIFREVIFNPKVDRLIHSLAPSVADSLISLRSGGNEMFSWARRYLIDDRCVWWVHNARTNRFRLNPGQDALQRDYPRLTNKGWLRYPLEQCAGPGSWLYEPAACRIKGWALGGR